MSTLISIILPFRERINIHTAPRQVCVSKKRYSSLAYITHVMTISHITTHIEVKYEKRQREKWDLIFFFQQKFMSHIFMNTKASVQFHVLCTHVEVSFLWIHVGRGIVVEQSSRARSVINQAIHHVSLSRHHKGLTHVTCSGMSLL